MSELIFTIGAFLVAITILIAVHEYGHFWVARRLGVKVLRYSIGFGRPLWRRRGRVDDIEYVVAAIPLGGYVKMLDEREGEVDPKEQHRAFNRQPVGKRFAIVAAGPAFNFLFAIVAYWAVFVVGVTGVKPVVGGVVPDSVAAYSGFQAGQHIVAVDGQATPIWDVALQAMLPKILDREPVEVRITDSALAPERTLVLDFSQLGTDFEPSELLRTIGLKPWLPPTEAVIGTVHSDTAAERSGIQVGDRITAIDGDLVSDWQQLVEHIKESNGRSLRVELQRGGERVLLNVAPEARTEDGATRYVLGVSPQSAPELPADMKAEYSYPLLAAVAQAATKTWDMSALTLKMIGKIVTGQASVKNLSGPIAIASYAGHSASAGVPRFLEFLAIVSVSLGILNLLPIPILDGGHLMYYLVEMLKGSPVSEDTEALGQRVGIVMLVMLMALAFYNDLMRVFG